jgi:hypothetical protein
VSDESGIFNSSTNSTGYRTTNVPEIMRLTTVADVGGNLNDQYFLFSTPQTDYYVWYNINSAGTDPAVASSTGIEITAATGATAVTIATNTTTALNAVTGSPFTAARVSDIVTITNTQTGNVTNIADGAATTTFTFENIQQGVWSDVAVVDVTGAFIEYEVPGVTYTPLTFEADGTSIVSTTNDTITIPAHGLSVRDQVILVSENSPATLPGGLSEDRLYYVIVVSGSTISLATSSVNATAGTAIDLTSTGSGTVSVKSNVIGVFPTLPNVDGTTFSVDTDDLSYATATEFPSGIYTIRYVVYGNGGGNDGSFEVIREFLIFCGKVCCIHNIIAEIPEKDCACDNVAVERALFAFTMLEALQHAAQSGQNTRANNINETLDILCSENFCSSCL